MRLIIFYFLLMAASSFAQKHFCGEKLWKITLPNFPALLDTGEWKHQIQTQPNFRFYEFAFSYFDILDTIAVKMVLNEKDTLVFPSIKLDYEEYKENPPFFSSALQIYIPKKQANRLFSIEQLVDNKGGFIIKKDTFQLIQQIGDTLMLKVWINEQLTLSKTFIENKQIRLYPLFMSKKETDKYHFFCGYYNLETPCSHLEAELAYKKEYNAQIDTIINRNKCGTGYHRAIIETP